MENLGAMADSWYTGFRKITDRDVLDLYCIYKWLPEARVCECVCACVCVWGGGGGGRRSFFSLRVVSKERRKANIFFPLHLQMSSK